MIRLEVFGASAKMASVAALLDESGEVSRVRLAAATQPEHAVVVAVVQPRAVDGLLDDLRRLGVPDTEVTLTVRLRTNVEAPVVLAFGDVAYVVED